jgi:hypothetical protein
MTKKKKIVLGMNEVRKYSKRVDKMKNNRRSERPFIAGEGESASLC